MTAPLIIDLDRVRVFWNAQHVTDIERRHGLPIGSLFGAAFADERLPAAITGQVTDAQWRAGVVAALAQEHGVLAVAEWSALPGEVDAPVLDIVRGQRRRGRTRVFLHIANALGVPPRHCQFVDDTALNVVAASQGGLSAHQYRTPEDLIAFLNTT